MAVYPYHNDLQKVASNMAKGNFGLWYNKFIPIKDFASCKAVDENGNENETVSFYHRKFKSLKIDLINNLIAKKHGDQEAFCRSLSSGYEYVLFKVRLKTPLITGIGETHPHEISMVFDHNMGIPYIPASGIKGIVRFTQTLGLCNDIPPDKIKTDKNGKEYFDDDDDWTNIPQLFGTQKNRGSVIFLDSYPEKMPELHLDIMNPHYGKYYNGESPPTDYLEPNPIKFLTVAKDTVFIFRALIDKKEAELISKVKNALIKALTEEGVGAKTSVGYGLFEFCKPEVYKENIKIASKIEEIKPVDHFITEIKLLKPSDAGPIGSMIDKALKELETDEEIRQFAFAVKEHMGKRFRKSKAREKLKGFVE